VLYCQLQDRSGKGRHGGKLVTDRHLATTPCVNNKPARRAPKAEAPKSSKTLAKKG